MHAVVLDSQTLPFVDVTAEMLNRLRGELTSQGITTVEEAVEAAIALRSGDTPRTWAPDPP